jgi:hypothetical protein
MRPPHSWPLPGPGAGGKISRPSPTRTPAMAPNTCGACSGATCPRLQPIKDFVTLVEKHGEGILTWHATHLSNTPARRDQLSSPGRQSPRPGLPHQNQDDHHHLPPCRQTPTTHPHPSATRVHALTLSNPLKIAKSLLFPRCPQGPGFGNFEDFDPVVMHMLVRGSRVSLTSSSAGPAIGIPLGIQHVDIRRGIISLQRASIRARLNVVASPATASRQHLSVPNRFMAGAEWRAGMGNGPNIRPWPWRRRTS